MDPVDDRGQLVDPLGLGPLGLDHQEVQGEDLQVRVARVQALVEVVPVLVRVAGVPELVEALVVRVPAQVV